MIGPCRSKVIRRRRLLGVTLILGVAAALLPGPVLSAPSIPPIYADLYGALDAKLRTIDGLVTSRGAAARHDVIFSAELLPANANVGEGLFREQTWPAVLLNLDRLQSLGVRGVKIAVKYPVLMPSFPRSSEYLEFYRRVAQELRRRNLKFLMQMTDGFRETEFSALPVEPYYRGLTWERYRREKRQMAETIIRELRPDYLTVQNEPGTQAHNTGLPMTVQNVTDLLEFVTRGLDTSGPASAWCSARPGSTRRVTRICARATPPPLRPSSAATSSVSGNRSMRGLSPPS